MTTVGQITGNLSNDEDDDVVGTNRPDSRSIAPVMQKARSLFPRKTAIHLSEITGYSTRACERWLGGQAQIPSDALAILLRSEYGREFLAAVMTDAQPRWWRLLLSLFASIDALSLQRAAKRRLREALDADRDTTAAIARADALLLQDSDFYRPHADAVCAMAGLPRGTMASTTKRKV